MFIFDFSLDKVSASIENSSASSEEKNPSDPVSIFKAAEGEIFSLAFHENFLLVGSCGQVIGYSWSPNQGKVIKKAWNIIIPVSSECKGIDEVNSLWINVNENSVYIGCGDNNIYCASLEDGKIIRKFTGHSDYIHSVQGNNNQIISASEDGSVKGWDPREKNATFTVEPYKNPEIHRPEFGKWQGTASISNDWFVCGGGARFAMFHLRTMQCTNVFAFPSPVHVSAFIDEQIFVGGHYKNVYQYSFNGDVVSEIPISGSAAYSAVWQNTPHKILSVCGTSNNIDICNFNYKDTTLNFYKKEETI